MSKPTNRPGPSVQESAQTALSHGPRTSKPRASKPGKPGKPRAGKPGKPGKVGKPGKRGVQRRPEGLAAFTEGGSVHPLVTAARAVLTVAFVAAIPTILGVEHGRRMLWTVAIASLPLFWLLGGYHLWRRICPLAVIAQLGRLVGRPGSKKAGSWLAGNYFLLQLGLMIAALSLRLIATNGTAIWLAGFLAAVAVAAAILGFVYTGKTWCNYICPVGMVEKIYTEPSRVAGLDNSQCKPCTACKKNCPDIDLEQGYWKEMEDRSRRIAYFSWPGVVVGFYVYYYLVAGTWDYYFSGVWTYESVQAELWRAPGFTFLAAIPRVAAAPLTLLAFGAVSFAMFAAGEAAALRFVRRARRDRDDDEASARASAEAAQRVRHRALVVAGFVAFNCFYFFGGQPTLRVAPDWVVHGFSVLVVFASSAMLFRRWSRSEAGYVQEKFASKLLKRWEWGDAPPSDRLQDIYLLHTERQKQRETRLAAYKEAVREMVADGVVTRSELAILDGLRAQLGVTEKEHERILSQLDEEERQLFDPDYQGSVELRLQHEQYERDLERAVLAAANAGATASPDTLEAIRQEHGIDPEEHASALAKLLDREGPLIAMVRERMATLEALARAARAASVDPGADRRPGGADDGDDADADVRDAAASQRRAGSRESYAASASLAFVRHLCLWRCYSAADRVLALLAPVGDPEAIDRARERLADTPLEQLADAAREAARLAAAGLPDTLEAEILDATVAILEDPGDATRPGSADSAGDDRNRNSGDGSLSPEPFWPLASDPSEYLRGAIAMLMSRWDDPRSREVAVAAAEDPSPLVRESAFRSLGARGRLTRALMSQALADPEPRVRNAAIRAVTGGTTGEMPAAPDPALLAQTTQGVGRDDGVYATLDANARIETLTTIEKMMLVRTVPMFRDLDPEDLEELTRITAEVRFLPGQFLCREGEPGGDVFLLVKGFVKVYTGGQPAASGDASAPTPEHVLNELGPGAVIGEMSAFDASPRSATVAAIGRVRALRLPAGEFKNLLVARPEIASGIIEELVARMRTLIQRR